MEPTTCTTPGCSKPEDREGHCFRHRVAGTSFAFRGGGGYGKQAFHDRTNAEFIREHIDTADVETTAKR